MKRPRTSCVVRADITGKCFFNKNIKKIQTPYAKVFGVWKRVSVSEALKLSKQNFKIELR